MRQQKCSFETDSIFYNKQIYNSLGSSPHNDQQLQPNQQYIITEQTPLSEETTTPLQMNQTQQQQQQKIHNEQQLQTCYQT